MSKTAAEVLSEVLSKTLKLDGKTVADYVESEGVYKDDFIPFVLGKDTERVTTLKGDRTELANERYSTGKREALEGWEKDLRTEFGVKDESVKGMDLVKHIVQATAQASGKDKLDEKAIKSHPLYIELEKERKKAVEDAQTALTNKEKELRAEFDGERNKAVVIAEARKLFRGLKPNVDKDPTIAAQQEADFLEKVAAGNYQVTQKDGKTTIVPMQADGKTRLEDDHNHAVSFDQHIGNMTRSRFSLQASEEKSAAPNPEKVGGSSDGGGAKKLASRADYLAEWGRIETEFMKDPKKMQAEHEALKVRAKEAGVL